MKQAFSNLCSYKRCGTHYTSDTFFGNY